MADHTTNESLWAHKKCMIVCILVSLSSFQFGLDFGLISGIQAMYGFLKVYGYETPKSRTGWNLSPERQQLIASLMTLGGIISSLLTGPLAIKLGRKSSLWLACFLCCVANVIMMVTTNIGALYVGRLLLGLANGMFMSFSQLYLSECAPAKFRGMALGAFSFWTALGGLTGALVDESTARIMSRASYLIPLGVIYIMPFVVGVTLLFVPESPRWLMEKGKTEKARKALEWLRPDINSVRPELEAMQAAIEEHKHRSGKALFFELWRNPVDRRRTILSIAVTNTQVASGCMFLLAYSTYFYQMAGVGEIQAFADSVILIAVGVVATILTTLTISRWGRRRVFLILGLVISGACQLTLAAVYQAVGPTNKHALKSIIGITMVYMLAFNGMITPYAWVSGGEIPSQRLRSYTAGIAGAIAFFGAWLTTFTAPYFINPAALNWGPKYGFIWAPSAFIAALWVFFFLPEVKGRSLEEIDEMFAARLPARKFRKYKCRGEFLVGDSTPASSAGSFRGQNMDKLSLDLKSGPTLTGVVVKEME